MKKRVKKSLAMLLLTTGMFSLMACNKKPSGDETVAPTKAGEESNGAGENNAGGTQEAKSLDDYEKVSEFNYFSIASGVETEQLNNSVSAKLVEEQTGYKVTYDQAPADATDAQTAITNIFLLKSDYQAVKVTKAQFYTLLELDALADITEYVDASKNLKEQIADFGWQTATKDGKIYAIPQKNPMNTNNVAICYRVDWLNEYNTANPGNEIPVPSEENGYSMTLTDYKTMLTYFATKVPQGGKAMAVDTNGVYLENILPAFGIYQEWAEVDGKLTYVANQPGFADYMAYIKDLYDSGLIQYQATSNDSGVVKSLQAQTVGAGRIAHWNANTVEASETASTNDNIGYITALIPDANKGDASAVRVFSTEGYAYYTVIPKYASKEQAAAVIDFADKKLEKDFFIKLVLGEEGVTYTVENDEYYPILPAFDESQGLADKFMDGTREEDYTKYWLCRTRKTPAQNKMFSIANFNIVNTGIQNPTSIMPPISEYDTYYSFAHVEVINQLVKTLYQTGVNTTVDEIKAVFSGNNGDEVTNAVNNWYSTWESKDSFNNVKPR